MSKKYGFTIAFLLLLGAVLYGMADRYLIEHAEIFAVKDIENEAAATAESTVAATDQPAPVVYDDWNYKSGEIDIRIEKFERGENNEKITYYVADVVLKDSKDLASAFAKNTFGRNIVESTSKIASDHNAILAINGDYYGFRSDGVIIRGGILYRNSPARPAMALFKDGTMKAVEEGQPSADDLLAAGVMNTFSFGPVLIRDGKVTGDFTQVKIDSNFGNRSIQNANPRTGIGIIAPNHYVFVVVDGRTPNYSRGMTLSEFAKVFEDLGCVEAYNLDGGGSSTLYFMGRVVNNPLGKQEERSVSDILYIAER